VIKAISRHFLEMSAPRYLH